jgi:hypothetical protein
MRTSCERCSDLERRGARRLARLALGVGCWTLAACSAEHAEVGSEWPPDPDSGDSGPPLIDGSIAPPDASNDLADAGIGPCGPLAPLRLYYLNLTALSPSTNINFIVKVENATTSAVPLGALQVRYYFTNELAADWTTDVFYTDTCCSNKITAFNDRVLVTVPTIPPRFNANAYLNIGFAASLGSLAVGDAVQVEVSFHAPGYARNLTQTNDFSYGAAATGTQTQWNDCPGAQCEARFTSCSITVHRDGVLVWGTPP